MKRYYYIVWRRSFLDDWRHNVIDESPAGWLAAQLLPTKPDTWLLKARPPEWNLPVIINQFEISAEEYTRLESLQ